MRAFLCGLCGNYIVNGRCRDDCPSHIAEVFNLTTGQFEDPVVHQLALQANRQPAMAGS